MSLEELRNAYRDLTLRYASMMDATTANEREMFRIASENSVLKNDVIRLGAEARVAQQNAQLLGDDYNERSREAQQQIAGLRKRIKALGFDPDAEEN